MIRLAWWPTTRIERTRCSTRGFVAGILLSGLLSWSGCAAFRPIDGIPARYVPDEVKAPSRSGKKTIDLSLLSQTQPSVYRLDAGDVLAIYVEGVIPRPNELPPVNLPMQGEDAAPALGYPIPVRQDGTISLPLLTRALPVRGLTVKEAEEAVRHAYTVERKILQKGNERVWVILHRPRQYRVLVIRQEGLDVNGATGMPGSVNLGSLKRGTGRAVTLPAYKNDVLHALAETGGLPGLDAENTIYVIRAKRRPPTVAPHPGLPTPTEPAWGHSTNIPLIPPLPEGHSAVPSPPAHLAPGVPGDTSLPPASPLVPPVPRGSTPDGAVPPLDINDPASGPQTRRPARAPATNFPLSLGFEPENSANRVVPASFDQSVASPLPAPMSPALSPSMTPGAAQWSLPRQTMSEPMSWGQSYWMSQTPTQPWAEVSAESWMGHSEIDNPTLENHRITKIPIRLASGEQAHFTERDILLEDGDIVFIESRDTEIFYTGGLLGGGQFTLPRDYDLDVMGAIAIAQAGRNSQQAVRSTGGVTALNNDVSISASQAIILRRMPNGSQVPIKVDLYRALRYPEERVLMQPGDYLLLQYTPLEAVGAFIERHLLESALFGVAAAQFNRN